MILQPVWWDLLPGKLSQDCAASIVVMGRERGYGLGCWSQGHIVSELIPSQVLSAVGVGRKQTWHRLFSLPKPHISPLPMLHPPQCRTTLLLLGNNTIVLPANCFPSQSNSPSSPLLQLLFPLQQFSQFAWEPEAVQSLQKQRPCLNGNSAWQEQKTNPLPFNGSLMRCYLPRSHKELPLAVSRN